MATFPPAELRATLDEVVRLLHERKETVSVAETVRSAASLLCSSVLTTKRPRLPEASFLPPSFPRRARAASTKEA